MQVSRRSLLGGALPLLAGASSDFQTEATASATVAERLAALERKASEIRTFEDFGAVGDFQMGRRRGTDDTAAIQAAIDWAHADDRSRALVMTGKNFLCGPITTYPYTTIVGTGRQTSNFVCRPGTRGKWWSDRGNGAQKLMLAGIAWYGGDEAGLTHIAEFGDTGIQFGTEGIIAGCVFRDAPNGYGLLVNGNVGIVENVTTQGCNRNFKGLGNGNHAQNLFSMEARTAGMEVYGWFVRGAHIEATESGGMPLLMNGDCRVHDLLISTATGTAFDHLVEIDTRNYDEWSLQGVQLLGSRYTVRNGILKVGSDYRGGTEPAAFTGASHVARLDIHSGRLSLRQQEWQAFALHLSNEGGTLRHRIGALADAATPARFKSGVAGASHVAVATPTGDDPSTGFAGGGKIGNPNRSQFIFDTAAQSAGDQSLQAVIQLNSSGTALTSWARVATQNVNGATKARLIVEFRDGTDGSAYDLTRLPAGRTIVIGLSGFLA